MDDEAFWTPHLHPDERIVWRADASTKLRRAEVSRRRTVAILLGLASIVLSGAFGYKLYESLFIANATPNLGTAVGAPLYAALALTFAVVFLAQLGRLNPKLPASVRFAATSTRLIALDASGAVVDEVDTHDIAGLILGGRRSAPDLFVLRKHDDTNVRAFAIEHIERPIEAKAIIEEHFLETAS
ncbi:MAG: hypothetical protein Q8R02_16655 [Hyphomonadaceae bacterium]|nr:hypothetical protein [Hyphomonadaceae bacterium]